MRDRAPASPTSAGSPTCTTPVGALIDEHAPGRVAIEALYFGRNVRSAFAVGQARGVVLLAAGQRGVPCSSTRRSRSRRRSAARARRQGPGRADGQALLGAPGRAAPATTPPTRFAVAICDAQPRAARARRSAEAQR